MSAAGDTVTDIAEAIRHYLAAHPDSSDTADGVASWWLGREHHGAGSADVLAALELLLRSGEIETETGPGGRIVYRARRS